MRAYKGYKFRLYPDREQEEQLRKLFSAVHFINNNLLIRWVNQPGMDFKQSLDDLIHDNPWLQFINRSILMYASSNLEKACRDNIRKYGPLPPNAEVLLKASYKSGNAVPSGEKNSENCNAADAVTASAAETAVSGAAKGPGEVGKSRRLPRFKTMKDRRESFTIASRNDVFIRYNRLTLGGQRGMKPIRVIQSRAFPKGSRICSATISRERSGEYYVSLLCSLYVETDPNAWKYLLGYANGLAVVGLDYSLPHFFVASDSYLRPDEKHLNNMRRSRDKLAAAQRRLSRMQKGSANFEKQRIRIARIHRDVANQRRDYLQKLSTQIAQRYDIVCVETLDLIEMEQQGKGFARRVQDNGWNEFVQMLEYKLRDRGKKLVRVGKRFPSSKRCHECSYINRELTLSDREWTCPVCGARHNRDINASLNIRDEGMRILLQQEKQAAAMVNVPQWNLKDTEMYGDTAARGREVLTYGPFAYPAGLNSKTGIPAFSDEIQVYSEEEMLI